MKIALPPLAELPGLPVDTVIDTRSPAEFVEDHIPGAINLPVLSNEERARVGTIYKQDSPFRARKVGGALVARNIAAHLEGPLAGMEGGWRPLIYCWRGGQRSGAFGLWLREVGWRAQTLEGGYQSYRRAVVQLLYDAPLPHRLLLLDGDTGTAKTEVLQHVAHRGGQVIDLEALANHRGSVLGVRPGGQPSQKGFETALAAALSALDPGRPVLVEAESSKVGERLLPPSLWKAMKDAPRLRVTATPDERTRYLCARYADLFADLPLFKEKLSLLTRLQGHARIAHWHALAEAGDFETLVRDLIERHYDTRYARHRGDAGPPLRVLDIGLSADALSRAADLIAAELERL
jgi:tRNA 2-selenouridine synthase